MDENNNQPYQQNNNPQQPTEASTAPILDVQPPNQDEVASSSATVREASRSESLQNSNATNSQISGDNTYAQNEATANVSKTPDPAKQPELLASSTKHKTPVLIIVVAIVIAAALAIFTVLAFTQQDKTTIKQQPANGTAQQPAESVTPESIDGVTNDVEAALNGLDAASDFPENELSDSSLGL